MNQLSKPTPSPIFIPTKPFKRTIIDTVKKDTVLVNTDTTTITIKDTIK